MANVVGDLQLQLTKAVKGGKTYEAIEILDTLAEQTVTLAILRKTKIGKTIAKLRKNADSEIASRAKKLVTRWKAVASEAKKKESAEGTAATSDPSHTQSTPADDGPEASRSTGDPKRDKIRKFFTDGLKPNEEELKASNPSTYQEIMREYPKVAVAIETALHDKYGHDQKKYIQRYRDLIFQLRDKKNPDINTRLLSGDIAPEDYVDMDYKAVASRMKALEREESRKWANQEQRSDIKDELAVAMTDEYRCGKCGSRETTYYQQQTRGADEPMTVFIKCMKCGNRWRD